MAQQNIPVTTKTDQQKLSEIGTHYNRLLNFKQYYILPWQYWWLQQIQSVSGHVDINNFQKHGKCPQ